MNNLYQEERLERIMAHIQKHHRIRVQDVCEMFGVSRDTARRDIVRLTEQGLVVRTQGGAILPSVPHHSYPYFERVNRASSIKRAIGQAAASLIDDGDFVILDTSTTILYLTDYIAANQVNVVTNGIDIAAGLSLKDNCTIHLLPGILDRTNRYVYGAATLAKLADYQVNKLFLGGGSITAAGLFTPEEEEGAVKKEMIRCADQVILLADHTKFQSRMFVKIASLDELDLIVTDQPLDGEWTEILREHHVDVLVANERNDHEVDL